MTHYQIWNVLTKSHNQGNKAETSRFQCAYICFHLSPIDHEPRPFLFSLLNLHHFSALFYPHSIVRPIGSIRGGSGAYWLKPDT